MLDSKVQLYTILYTFLVTHPALGSDEARAHKLYLNMGCTLSGRVEEPR